MKKPRVQQRTERRISAALRLVLVAVLLVAQIALVLFLSTVLKQRAALAYTALELVAFVCAVYIWTKPGTTSYKVGWIFLILTGISVVYGAFSACVQTDLKYINAYSSVSHCGLVLFAILMMNQTACTGAVLQMLSHGLMTALFFALIGMIYGRTHTRDVRELSGLMKIMPFLAVCYVIAGLANLGLPGLSGFIAEMTIFTGSFQHPDTFHRVWTVIACSSIVITAVYILRLVGKILYGTCTNKHHLTLSDATWDERTAVIILIACVAALGMAPWWISGMIGDSVLPITDLFTI